MINMIMIAMEKLGTQMQGGLILSIFVVFIVACIVKALIYYTSYAENKFVKDIDKKISRTIDTEDLSNQDFSSNLSKILDDVHHASYELRTIRMRRKFDRLESFSDRLFSIPSGSLQLVDDLKKQTSHIDLLGNTVFDNISYKALTLNPIYNKVWGIVSIPLVNRFLAVLPGMFIVCGIFGTFLGITLGLPQLAGIDPANMIESKHIMGSFLSNMAFSMNTSLAGILFSLAFSVVNTLFSYKSMRQDTFLRLSSSLELLWNWAAKGKDLQIPSINSIRDVEPPEKSVELENKAS